MNTLVGAQRSFDWLRDEFDADVAAQFHHDVYQS